MSETTLENISFNPFKFFLTIALVGTTLFGEEIKEKFIDKNTVKFVLDSYDIENAQFNDKTVYDSEAGSLK